MSTFFNDRCWCSESEVLRFVKNKKSRLPLPTRRSKSHEDVVLMDVHPTKNQSASDEVSVEPQPLKHVDSLSLLSAKGIKKMGEECEASPSKDAATVDSDLHLRSFFSQAERGAVPASSNDTNSKLRGLFSSDSTVSQLSSARRTVSFDPRWLTSGSAEGAAKTFSGTRTTTDVPSLLEASCQTSWSEAKASFSEFYQVVNQLREAGALLQKTAEMIAHGGLKSERASPVAAVGKPKITTVTALRLAAIEATNLEELLAALDNPGTVSGYVRQLELIAEDYVRLLKNRALCQNHSLV